MVVKKGISNFQCIKFEFFIIIESENTWIPRGRIDTSALLLKESRYNHTYSIRDLTTGFKSIFGLIDHIGGILPIDLYVVAMLFLVHDNSDKNVDDVKVFSLEWILTI